MSSEQFTLSRLIFLEKENRALKEELKLAVKERDCLRIKNRKLCEYSCKIENVIDNIDKKISKLKGKQSSFSSVVSNTGVDPPEVENAVVGTPEEDAVVDVVNAAIDIEDAAVDVVNAAVDAEDAVVEIVNAAVDAEDAVVEIVNGAVDVEDAVYAEVAAVNVEDADIVLVNAAVNTENEIAACGTEQTEQTEDENAEAEAVVNVAEPQCNMKNDKKDAIICEDGEESNNEGNSDLSKNVFFTDKQLENVHHLLVPSIKKMEVNAADETTESDEILNSFYELNFNKDLLRAVEEYGIEKIHNTELTSTIAVLRKGQAVVVEDPFQQSNQVGKIATFALFILQQIDPSLQSCQAIILAPNRVLVDKIKKLIKKFGKYMIISSHVCVGGGTRVRDEKDLLTKNGIQIIVGTPGRVADLVSRKNIITENIKHFLISKASDLLSRDFVYQTEKIFKKLPKTAQTILYTSKITDDVNNWCNKCIESRNTVHIKEVSRNLKCIKQFYLSVDVRDWKWKPVLDIRRRIPEMRTVIICNGRENAVELLKHQLRKKGQKVLATHANMKAGERENIVKQFCDGDNTTLITTEFLVSGNGNFGLQNVGLLINYELPILPQNYYTRISFCGPEFEKRGIVLNLISGGSHTQLELLKIYEKTFQTNIDELTGNGK